MDKDSVRLENLALFQRGEWDLLAYIAVVAGCRYFVEYRLRHKGSVRLSHLPESCVASEYDYLTIHVGTADGDSISHGCPSGGLLEDFIRQKVLEFHKKQGGE